MLRILLSTEVIATGGTLRKEQRTTMLVQNYSTVPFSHRCKAFTAHRSSASQSKLGREFSDVQSHSARASAVSKCERISMSEDLLRSRSYPALRRSTFQRPEARISSSSINSASENAAESNGTTGQQESLEVLDMESYFSGRDERLEFCRKLREQCHKVGFFYVKNHGVSEELCDSMLEMGRKFFDLPVELKVQILLLCVSLYYVADVGLRILNPPSVGPF